MLDTANPLVGDLTANERDFLNITEPAKSLEVVHGTLPVRADLHAQPDGRCEDHDAIVHGDLGAEVLEFLDGPLLPHLAQGGNGLGRLAGSRQARATGQLLQRLDRRILRGHVPAHGQCLQHIDAPRGHLQIAAGHRFADRTNRRLARLDQLFGRVTAHQKAIIVQLANPADNLLGCRPLCTAPGRSRNRLRGKLSGEQAKHRTTTIRHHAPHRSQHPPWRGSPTANSQEIQTYS